MKQLTKAEVLSSIRNERLALEHVLGLFSEAALLEPGVIANPAPGQTAKDVMAHLSAWERRMLACAKAALNDQTWPPYAKTHEFNAAVLADNQPVSLEEVRLEFGRSFADVLGFVEALREEQLAKNGVWQLLAFNTYNHYKWAHKALRKWLNAKGRLPARHTEVD